MEDGVVVGFFLGSVKGVGVIRERVNCHHAKWDVVIVDINIVVFSLWVARRLRTRGYVAGGSVNNHRTRGIGNRYRT